MATSKGNQQPQDNLGFDPSIAEKLKEALGMSKQEMKELQAMSTVYGKSLKISTEEIQKSIAGRNKEVQLVETLHKTMMRVGQETEKGLKLKNLTEQIQETSNDLAAEQNRTMADLVLKQTMLNTGLTGAAAEQAKNYKLLLDEGAITQELYDSVVKRLQMEQKRVHHLEEELEMQEAIADSIREIQEESEAWKKSFTKVFETAKAIGRDPKLMGAFMMSEGIKKLGEFQHGFKDLKALGLSSGQAMEGMFKGMSLSNFLGLSDTKGVLEGVVEEYGNINALSKDTVTEVGTMAKKMGITGQEALKVNAALSQIPGETSESAANAMKLTGELAKQQGIAPGKIMKDIAKNTEAMALYGSKGAKEFGKTAIELHKMGIEIGTASKMASGLLDFENSINKQMEASVLLGREINFDKARELALAGDLAGAAKEVVAQAGGEAEWGRMNVLQKQKLAEAAGMTVEEMQKQIDAQKEHNKYFGEESSLMDNILGNLMSYGGKAVDFFKENGMLLMTTMQFLSNTNALQMVGNGIKKIGTGLQIAFNGVLKATKLLFAESNATEQAGFVKRNAQYIKDKAQAAWMATKKFFGGGAGKVAAGATDKVTSAATDKLTEAPGGKQTGGLTDAISKIDVKKVLAGAAALVLVAAAVYVFAKAAQEFTSVPWSSIGKAIVSMLALVGALGLIGAIMMSGVGALAILAGAAAMLIMAAALFVLGKAIQEIAKGFDMFIPSLLQLAPMSGDLVALGASLLVLGAGMIAFGAASFFAFPGMILAGVGLGAVALGLGLVAAAGAAAFPVIVGLTALAAMAPMFTELAGAISAMAVGLVAFASAGIFTLPTIAGLIALSLVAPVLIALGKSIQFDLGGGSKVEGGEGGQENDKMDVLIGKIDQLIAVASKGGTVNMDGKKVGEIVRLSINSSGVR